MQLLLLELCLQEGVDERVLDKAVELLRVVFEEQATHAVMVVDELIKCLHKPKHNQCFQFYYVIAKIAGSASAA